MSMERQQPIGETAADSTPLYSVSESLVALSDVDQDFATVANAGEKYVAPSGTMLRQSGAEATASLLAKWSLKASSYHAGLQLLSLDDHQSDEALNAAIRAAAAIGAPIVSVNAGAKNELSYSEADANYVARLRRCADLASSEGIALGIEPIHPLLCQMGFIHTIRHGAEIVEQVPGAALIIDIAHVFWDRFLPDDINTCADRIGLVQLGQVDGAALSEKRWQRAPLGPGPVPLADIAVLLHTKGYRGYYEDETFLIADGQAERIHQIRAAAQWFRGIWS